MTLTAMKKVFLPLVILFFTCSTGKLKLINDLPNYLEEVSGTEYIEKNGLVYFINDAGNNPYLYAFTKKGEFNSKITLDIENDDWEDLASDNSGHIYIGDFGNNGGGRDDFQIYKVDLNTLANDKIKIETIEFTVPKDAKKKDFEAIFHFGNRLYLFTKERKKTLMLSVPDKAGEYKAKIEDEFNLDGKDNEITSADISPDGKKVVLLNHDKLWLISGYTGDDFMKGQRIPIDFEHNSQKEGISFMNNNVVFITDEGSDGLGQNLYKFDLSKN